MASEPLARVSQQRAENDLDIDESRGNRGEPAQPAAVIDRWSFFSAPLLRGEERQTDGQCEKSLSETGMNYREGVLQQDNSQPTEHALQNDHAERANAEPAQPTAILFDPERHGKNDAQETDTRCDQTMTVFVKDTADHPRPRVEKHVVAEGRRPIRHGQSGAQTCHQTTDEK